MRNPKTSGSILVELFWYENVLWVFIIRPDLVTPHVESYPFLSSETGQLVNELLDAVSAPNTLCAASSWSHLSELIVKPLRKYLRPSERVIMIPYGMFHFLPLHLLLLDGAPLVESHAVVYAPSASVLHYCQQKNPKRVNCEFRPQTITAIGLDFENEADIVAQYFNAATVLTCNRTTVSKELVMESCRRRDVIHFSAHGEFKPDNPEKSGLVLPLSDKEPRPRYLTLSDVYDMQLNSYLVTLGACSSGLGDYVSGDEVVGITSAFIYAGTPSVLASLWPVRNDPTLQLMESFYVHLLRHELDKADALREAQLEVRELFSAPADWAGFILTGDWL